MKKIMMLLLAAGLILFLTRSGAETVGGCWRIVAQDGTYLTDVAEEPEAGDQYISADNRLYEIVHVAGAEAVAEARGSVELPDVGWLDADAALPVSALTRRIALYCTHSDESYEPTDGYYTTTDRGSIYEVAQALAEGLSERGAETFLSDTLHHPHDAGAYRRSRQTAVQLLKSIPDCLLDIHRDGIPDPNSYAAELGGQPASKVRILVGRGNQNMEVNKEFALLVKAIADRVYPGLIKDIYMGRGTFNQDLLPRSILLECGTYTLEKERVLRSMDMMAEVIDRALYGGVTGSAGQMASDVTVQRDTQPGGVTIGQSDTVPAEAGEGKGVGSGLVWVGVVLIIGLIGYGVLSAGSLGGGMRKAGRNLSEMTGGLIGKKPAPGEDHRHS
ncbi:MAG: stage II sporulation protein P [Clostridiales bacterium]|nr:stage II sporulation protein P [Clostridiales bacterium]